MATSFALPPPTMTHADGDDDCDADGGYDDGTGSALVASRSLVFTVVGRRWSTAHVLLASGTHLSIVNSTLVSQLDARGVDCQVRAIASLELQSGNLWCLYDVACVDTALPPMVIVARSLLQRLRYSTAERCGKPIVGLAALRLTVLPSIANARFDSCATPRTDGCAVPPVSPPFSHRPYPPSRVLMRPPARCHPFP
ncbi:hypothetical protein SPRG_12343 [Saprolegnia parasitica CBS 223.65]|uniref:Uncharacterized protein n=1 Tax=Saprolegnia parasitica (strain CBS 223.65) TaxID=695850 RepID=A0A067C4V7_SAPPC|nr:hypothetical protein SPRG_12343 [Saprolegnia parasitica CBS 223.65]KDO21842.1 hypothetical protein SPRG_12343 [Saprolegnia parasitica CBS 223.65]|eukprot:XP_012207400.1 hypothetical protein SPRG_12343 [Saprolegnia parasitica CBS 223.65]